MSEPYYRDDLVTLYLGDCRDETAWVDADALVTDPPYGIDYRSNWASESMARSIRGDKTTEVRDAALQMWPSNRAALVFGTWRRPRPDATRTLLVWDTKGALGMGDLRIPWKPAHQEVYVLGRDGWTGKRTTDVLVHAPVQSMAKNGRLHPHQKPVSLLVELIEKTTGTVADPFAGVGSTLLAASSLGRPSIGVEVEERYCELAAERLTKAREEAA